MYGEHDSLIMSLVEHCREAELARAEALDESLRLRKELESFTKIRPEHERALVVVTPHHYCRCPPCFITVYHDPRVKMEVVRTPLIDWEDDFGSRLAVPYWVKQMLNDSKVKAEVY